MTTSGQLLNHKKLVSAPFLTRWLVARANCVPTLRSLSDVSIVQTEDPGLRRYPSWSVAGDKITSGAGPRHPPCWVSLWRISVTITNVTHISHFFSGAIAKTELDAGPGQVLEVEGVVINIEDGHQKKALSNLWHKKVFLLHDCSWLLWMPLHFMILIAWHWPIIKWKVPSLMESWIKKVKKKVEGYFFSPALYYPLEGLWTAFKPQIKKISQSQLVLWRQCCGRAGGGVWIPARLSVAWSSRVTPTMRFN